MDFVPFPKVPRLSRECVITEKLDGTNASVTVVDRFDQTQPYVDLDQITAHAIHNDAPHYILAASRSRFITPEDDNFGFAKWVRDNTEELVKLGPGTHWGEWWGQGIQRNYGLKEKRFSLFNTGRWSEPGTVHLCDVLSGVAPVPAPSCCHVVPVICRSLMSDDAVFTAMNRLAKDGSRAAPGFMDPEGIMVYHTAANQYFKKTFKGDEKGKGG